MILKKQMSWEELDFIETKHMTNTKLEIKHLPFARKLDTSNSIIN